MWFRVPVAKLFSIFSPITWKSILKFKLLHKKWILQNLSDIIHYDYISDCLKYFKQHIDSKKEEWFNQRVYRTQNFSDIDQSFGCYYFNLTRQVSIYFGVCWNCIFLLEWEDLKNLNEKLTLYLMTGCSGVWKSCYIQTRKTETRWSKGSLDDYDLQLQRLNLFF